jgi:hypothetical protein
VVVSSPSTPLRLFNGDTLDYISAFLGNVNAMA